MTDMNLKDIGPLQIFAVAFHKPDFTGKIREELQKLRDQKFVRIVDGLVIQKSQTGEIAAIEENDITQSESKQFGALIGGWIGLGTGRKDTALATSKQMSEAFNERYQFGLDKDDIEEMAADLPKGDAAMILLIEHSWLTPLRNAMREGGGTLLAQDFLSPELLMSVGQAAVAA